VNELAKAIERMLQASRKYDTAWDPPHNPNPIVWVTGIVVADEAFDTALDGYLNHTGGQADDPNWFDILTCNGPVRIYRQSGLST